MQGSLKSDLEGLKVEHPLWTLRDRDSAEAAWTAEFEGVK